MILLLFGPVLPCTALLPLWERLYSSCCAGNATSSSSPSALVLFCASAVCPVPLLCPLSAFSTFSLLLKPPHGEGSEFLAVLAESRPHSPGL